MEPKILNPKILLTNYLKDFTSHWIWIRGYMERFLEDELGVSFISF